MTDSFFNRIIQTQKIRCGYIECGGLIVCDGKLSGVYFDVMEKIGEKLGFEIEWVRQYEWANLKQAINSGDIDCIASVYVTAIRSLFAIFSKPFYYGATGIYVRFDDHRFDGNYLATNHESVKIGLIDGEGAVSLAHEKFSFAKHVYLPENVGFDKLLPLLEAGTIDVALIEQLYVDSLMPAFRGRTKNIAPSPDFGLFATAIMLPQGAFDLREMLNGCLEEMLGLGIVDDIVKKNQAQPISKSFKS